MLDEDNNFVVTKKWWRRVQPKKVIADQQPFAVFCLFAVKFWFTGFAREVCQYILGFKTKRWKIFTIYYLALNLPPVKFFFTSFARDIPQ